MESYRGSDINKEVKIMGLLLSLVLLMTTNSGCRQSFSYPVMSDVSRIEIVTKDNTVLKSLNDPSTVESVVRFIDERRSRWCAPASAPPNASVTLNFYSSQKQPRKIGLGNGFLIVELANQKYLLKFVPDEQRNFFRLLAIEEGELKD